MELVQRDLFDQSRKYRKFDAETKARLRERIRWMADLSVEDIHTTLIREGFKGPSGKALGLELVRAHVKVVRTRMSDERSRPRKDAVAVAILVNTGLTDSEKVRALKAHLGVA